MDSWRAVEGGSRLADIVMLLLGDIRVVPGVSAESERNQHTMQVDQRRQRTTWGADLHAGAGDRIQHPGSHNRHYAGQRLNVNNVTDRSSLAVVAADATAIKRMPSIVDNDIPPDMGRMTPQ
jgi:hypothetical protein